MIYNIPTSPVYNQFNLVVQSRVRESASASSDYSENNRQRDNYSARRTLRYGVPDSVRSTFFEREDFEEYDSFCRKVERPILGRLIDIVAIDRNVA